LKVNKKYITISILFCLFLIFSAKGQNSDVSVVFGEKNITLTEQLTITAVVSNVGEGQNPDCKFPEIANFKKTGVSKTKNTSIVSGQKIIICKITQNYNPTQEGTFKLNNLKVLVNGAEVKVETNTVVVTKTGESPKTGDEGDEDFSDFVEGKKTDFIEVKEDVFLSLTTDKKNPYVGEAFNVTFAFYVAESNGAEMKFDKNELQIPEIIKKIKPENCWEENFGLIETKEQDLVINGKKYHEYKFYQATLYPLNNQVVKFPSVTLNLLKFNISKTGERKPVSVSYSTKALAVQPRELPPHPLRQQMSVGVFLLKERVNQYKTNTGKAIEYHLEISGDGNVSTVKLPDVKSDSLFDFYPPEEKSSVVPQGRRVIGTKAFTFQIIPKQAGNFELGSYFYWVYFDPQRAKYDTLRSKIAINIVGETIESVEAPSTEGSIYDGIENVATVAKEINYSTMIRGQANVLIAIMLLGMIYAFWPKKK
jgi:hypothetical protein